MSKPPVLRSLSQALASAQESEIKVICRKWRNRRFAGADGGASGFEMLMPPRPSFLQAELATVATFA
jgi:hypothetical protein